MTNEYVFKRKRANFLEKGKRGQNNESLFERRATTVAFTLINHAISSTENYSSRENYVVLTFT